MEMPPIDITEYGMAGVFILLLVLLWRWTSTKVDRIIDNGREDLNNERKEFLAALSAITESFKEEVKEVRHVSRQEQEDLKEVLTRITEELRKVSEVLIRHEVALERLLVDKDLSPKP